MTKFLRFTAVLYIVLLPFEMFKIPYLHMSLSKYILLILIVLLVVEKIILQKITSLRMFLVCSGLFFSVLISSGYSYFTQVFYVDKFIVFSVSFLVGIFILYAYFDLISTGVLTKKNCVALIKYSVLAIFLFAFYNVFSTFFLHTAPFSFLGGEYFQPLDSNIKIANGHRIFLPTGTPPRLAFIVGEIALVLFSLVLFQRPKRNIYHSILLMVSIILILLTGSRSGLLPLILSCAVLVLSHLIYGNRLRALKTIGFFLLLMPIIFTAAQGFLSETRGLSFDFSEGTSLARHIAIRWEALQAIHNSPFITNLIGHGTGQFGNFSDSPYTFTMLLTVFFENGVPAAIFLVIIFIWMVRGYMTSYFKYNSPANKAMYFSLGIYLFCSNLFYELKAEPYMWVSFAFIIALPRCENENIRNNNVL